MLNSLRFSRSRQLLNAASVWEGQQAHRDWQAWPQSSPRDVYMTLVLGNVRISRVVVKVMVRVMVFFGHLLGFECRTLILNPKQQTMPLLDAPKVALENPEPIGLLLQNLGFSCIFQDTVSFTIFPCSLVGAWIARMIAEFYCLLPGLYRVDYRDPFRQSLGSKA